MIQAKGKIRRRHLEEEAEIAKELVKSTPVRKKKDERQSHFPTRELRNVMADTFERVWEETMPGYPWKSEAHRRLNAEDMALQMIRLVKYGIPEGHAAKISEHEFHPPKCKEHR